MKFLFPFHPSAIAPWRQNGYLPFSFGISQLRQQQKGDMAHQMARRSFHHSSRSFFATDVNEATLPIYDGNLYLDIFRQAERPEFFQSVARSLQLRQDYLRDGCVFIKGGELVPILRGIGATEEDLERLKTISHSLDPDPTVDFRTLSTGRFSVNTKAGIIERLQNQTFILTTADNYKRHDSDIRREFGELGETHQNNTVIQAMLVFKAWITQDVPVPARPGLDYNQDTVLTQVFNVHTFTNNDIQGYPALEGVHQDGCDHTMTVLLGSSNITPDSGVTFVHDKQEETGIQPHETNIGLLKGRYHHRGFLDTLLFKDNSVKHSVTPVYAQNKSQTSYRDMFVILSRKPRTEMHKSGLADCFVPHEKFKKKFPIWVPPIQGSHTCT